MSERTTIKAIMEAVLMTSHEPLKLTKLVKLFPAEQAPDKQLLRELLAELATDYVARGVELKELATGYCFQAKAEFAPYIQRLQLEKPPRYTRATLETLVLIAYRQPITRAEIEEIRGVVVSSHIIKTLLDRQWVRVVGHKDVPGHPALYATTPQFLAYFNLKELSELPPLTEFKDLEEVEDALTEQLSLAQLVEQIEDEVEVFEHEVTDAPLDQETIEALVKQAQAMDLDSEQQAELEEK